MPQIADRVALDVRHEGQAFRHDRLELPVAHPIPGQPARVELSRRLDILGNGGPHGLGPVGSVDRDHTPPVRVIFARWMGWRRVFSQALPPLTARARSYIPFAGHGPI